MESVEKFRQKWGLKIHYSKQPINKNYKIYHL